MEIVRTEKLVKRFGTYPAVNNISISIEKGKIFGLLGPNGAGKTTMIRMLTNIFLPDEGEIFLFNEKTGPNHQNRIGYLPEERGLYKKIKVIDQLVYFGQLKGLTRFDAHSRAIYWLKKLGADGWAAKKIQELSKGMQQKVQFISTILHNPDLLILDEPFSGFDPINAELLKKIIIEFSKEGKTIILSTHVMEQVEQLCEDIILINKGQKVLDGSVRDIKRSFGRDTILMEFEGSSNFLDEFPQINIINRSENRAEFRLPDKMTNANQILEAAAKNAVIYRYEYVEPSLNEIFIDVVSKMGVGNE